MNFRPLRSVFLVLIYLSVFSPPLSAADMQQIAPSEVPEGLPAEAWQSIQQQIRQASYHPEPQGDSGDYVATNQQQQFQLQFAKNGKVQVQNANQALSLHLSAYGYGDDLQAVPDAQAPVAKNNRLEYRRGDLVEWYINRENGVEQGFTLEKPPTSNSFAKQGNEPLRLILNLNTQLIPVLSADAQSLVFKNADGQVVFNYDKLHVFDAKQQVMPAYFELTETNTVQIVVADARAVYPLVIDPLITSSQELAKADRDESESLSYFGRNVSISEDMLLVSSGKNCLTSNGCGAVYVFNKPIDGWAGTLTPNAKLIASDAATSDSFGSSMAISGDTVVVGAYNKDCAASGDSGDCGIAYVFNKPVFGWSGNLTENAKLISSDIAGHDRFGAAVAINNNADTILVGAKEKDCSAGNYCGAAYVFNKPATGWSGHLIESSKLIASDAAGSDYFGASVAISGDSMIIGAHSKDCFEGEDCGVAYVFNKPVAGWNGELNESAKLTASDATEGALFGNSFAIISAQAVAVGAPWKDCSMGDDCGAVYVFIKPVGGWSGNVVESAKLMPSNLAADDVFGYSIAASGNNTVMVGTSNKEVVYVFNKPIVGWSGELNEDAMLSAEGGSSNDSFGNSVAMSSNVVLVGAHTKDCAVGMNCGAAYVFNKPVTGWSGNITENARLSPKHAISEDAFGYSVAISGDTVVVGAPYKDCFVDENCGFAYVFSRPAGGWSNELTESARLVNSNIEYFNEYFGYSVAISDDTVVVGAPGKDEANGATYVFNKPTAGWNGELNANAKLSAGDPGLYDYFGASVAISGNTVVVGAKDKDCTSGYYCGAAYVFEKTTGSWAGHFTESAKLTASDEMPYDYFGNSVAISKNTVVIGAYKKDCIAGNDCGAAYVFNKPATGWSGELSENAKLGVSDAADTDYFGESVAISGNTVVSGAPSKHCSTALGCGAAYVFLKPSAGWSGFLTESAKLSDKDENAAFLDEFGSTVSISGNAVVVGSMGKDCAAGFDCGAAYVFNKPTTGWSGHLTESTRLGASDLEALDRFGNAVDISGNTVVVGHFLDNCADGSEDCGSIYFFAHTFSNTAPIYNTDVTPFLPAIDEDIQDIDILGVSVASILSTSIPINDYADLPYTKQGITVTGVSDENDGQWQYSIDNTINWLPIGTVSDNNALLLESNSLLRFIPATDFNSHIGTKPNINFRAWDHSNDCAGPPLAPIPGWDRLINPDSLSDCVNVGDYVDASINGSQIAYTSNWLNIPGGQSAYSGDVGTANITINPTSDPLVLDSLKAVNKGIEPNTPDDEGSISDIHDISSNARLVAVQGQVYSLDAVVSDPQDAPVINRLSFSFTPTPWIGTTKNADTSATITLAPSRSTAVAIYDLALSVTEVDGVPNNHTLDIPVTLQLLTEIDDQVIPKDAAFQLDFTTGVTYENLSFSIQSGNGNIEESSGLYSWTPNVTGNETITVRVTDTVSSHYAEQSVTLTVVDAHLIANAAAPTYQDINTIQVPVLSGNGSYQNAAFKHIEVALQDITSGKYAVMDGNGYFSSFTSDTPQWTVATDNLSNREFTLATVDLSWNLAALHTQNVTFQPNATYKIWVRGVDSSNNAGNETSRDFTYNGTQAATRLYLQASTPALLNKDNELELFGKLSRFPDVMGLDLSGLAIELHITRPDRSSEVVSKATFSDTGQYSFKLKEGDFSTLDQEGAYAFQTKFTGAAHLAAAESEAQPVLVGSSAGYVLLIQGKVNNLEGQGPHYKTATRIYNHLLKRGFERNNIAFLSDFNATGSEQPATLANVQTALDDLKTKMNGSPAPLYVIMVDHGDVEGNFRMGNEQISPVDLNNYLNNFEAGLSATAKNKPRIVIVGACYSGNFVPAVSQAPSTGNAGRVVISSAAADEVSYKGPMEPDGVRSGELFLEEFFFKLADGKSFKAAFDAAVETVSYATRGSSNATGNAADQALQHPLLDDNGDRFGSNQLSDGGDGDRAADLFLGAVIPTATNYSGEPAAIVGKLETLFLGESDTHATLDITVNHAGRVNAAPVDIREPSTALQKVLQAVTEQAEIDELKRIQTMACTQNTLPHSCSVNYNSFITPGKYELFHFVRDNLTYGISPLERRVVYKNRVGNTAPDAFNLTTPADTNSVPNILIFDWEDSYDVDGLSYTFIVAEDASFADNVIVVSQEELGESMTFLDDSLKLKDGSFGLKDQTTYYWKVKAVDNYGMKTTSPIFSFTVDNPNALPNLASISPVSNLGFNPVSNARLTLNNPPNNLINSQGQTGMLLSLPPNTYVGTLSASGYQDKSVTIDTTAGHTHLAVPMTPTQSVLGFDSSVYSVDEGSIVTVRVKRTGDILGAASVQYSITGDAADYNGSASGILSWPTHDATDKTISLAAVDDVEVEASETLSIQLSNPSNAILSNVLAGVTIQDNDIAPDVPPTPEPTSTPVITPTPIPTSTPSTPTPVDHGTLAFTANSYNTEESQGLPADLLVHRHNSGLGKVTVQYVVTPDSVAPAFVNQDYSESLGTLTWEDGDQTPKPLSLSVLDDQEAESEERLIILLSNPTGGAQLGLAQTVLIITDTDTAAPVATPTPGGTPNNNTGGNSTSGTGTPPSVTTPPPVVQPDSVIRFSTDSITINEGETAQLNVSRTGTTAISVEYLLLPNSTATVDSDFTGSRGQLSWAEGDTTDKHIEIPTIDDNQAEGQERVAFVLVNPSEGAVLGVTSETRLLINDNDVATAGSIGFAESVYQVKEEENLVMLVVTRQDGIGAVSVDYMPLSGTAKLNQDYRAQGNSIGGTLNWAEDEIGDKVVAFAIDNDDLAEGLEYLTLELSNATGGAVINQPQTRVEIAASDLENMPELGTGLSLLSESVNVNYQGGIALNGGLFETRQGVWPEDEAEMHMLITTEPNHVGQHVNLLIGALNVDNGELWLEDTQGNAVKWNGQAETLLPAHPQAMLLEKHPVALSSQLLQPGHWIMFVAYQTSQGDILINDKQQIEVYVYGEQTLPNLGAGIGLEADLATSMPNTTQVTGSAFVNGKPANIALPSDFIQIRFDLSLDEHHIGQAADLIAVVVREDDALPAVMLDKANTLQPINIPFTHFKHHTALGNSLRTTLPSHMLKPGTNLVLIAYQLNNGSIVFNGEQPLAIQMQP